MDRTEAMGQEKISKLLIRFSIPAIIGMLVNALYNVVDRIFVGNGVGTLAIAGITISYPLMIMCMAFAMLIGIGATSLLSIRLGEGKKEEAELIMGNAFVLLILISLLVALVGIIWLDPLLQLVGASSEVLPYARDFMYIILWGNVLMGIGFGMNNFIRAEGNPKTAMLTMLIGAVLNVVLNPLFIFVFKWGIKGSAWATVISQGVSAVWVMNYILSAKSTLKIRRKNLRLDPQIVRQIITLGSAPFAIQVAASLLNFVLNASLKNYGGDIAIAGMGIVSSLSMLILMPIFGINQGAQPIIGYNYGAKKYDRVKETLKLAMLGATGVVMIGFTITQLYPREIIALFSPGDQGLIEFGAHALRIFLLMFPIVGAQIVGANYFQAVGKPKQAMFLSLTRQVLVLIPMILILPKFFGLDGILYAGPVSDLISAVLTGLLLSWELKRYSRQEGELAGEPQLQYK